MIRVKHDNNGEIKGFFPAKIDYPNNEIDTESKTIDGYPYIEINENDYFLSLGKKMHVNKGVFSEYVDTDKDELLEAKRIRLKSRELYLNNHDKYWIRKLRENIDVPQDVVYKSNMARAEYGIIEHATTLGEVKLYSEDFQ